MSQERTEMTEDPAERIRELNRRIAEWEDETTFAIQQGRDSQKRLEETMSLALWMVTIGSIPSVFWIICWGSATTAASSVAAQIFDTCGALVVYAIVAVAAARGTALMAHWWFHRAKAMERLATICMSLTADVALFGWVYLIARW